MLINDILDRLKEHVEPKTDAALARALNVEPQNIVNWRNRGTIPAEKIYKFAVDKQLSFHWLFTGQESHTGGSENMAGESELQMKLFDQLGKRLDDQHGRIGDMQSRIDAQAKAISRYTDTATKYSDRTDEIWKAISTKDINLATVNESIRELTMRLLDMREDMNRAADNKDVSLLKKVAGD
jgi:archaellum component FlaC